MKFQTIVLKFENAYRIILTYEEMLRGRHSMVVQQMKRENVTFKQLADEDLLVLIDKGNVQALEFLINKYKRFVWSKSQTYYLMGGDKEDIIQEGMIGLYKAICDYDKTKLASFKGFADLCITRQIITAIKSATRQKHLPLNSYVSLDKPLSTEESDRALIEVITNKDEADPQSILLAREGWQHTKLKLLETLSHLEHRSFDLYLQGYTYDEIAREVNRHVKAVDNALVRVRKKLDHLIVAEKINI